MSKRLLDDGHGVVGFDILHNDELPKQISFIQGDIRESTEVEAIAVNCDTGVHLAALAPKSSERDIASVNVFGAYSFLRAAKEACFYNTIIASSAPVHLPPCKSDNTMLPKSSIDEDHIYDLTKSLQEVIANDFHTHGLPVLCLRFGHVVFGNDELNLKRTKDLRKEDYCRGGWVALEDVVDACAAALQITPSSTELEIINVVGSKGARSRFHTAETENRLGINIKYEFSAFE